MKKKKFWNHPRKTKFHKAESAKMWTQNKSVFEFLSAVKLDKKCRKIGFGSLLRKICASRFTRYLKPKFTLSLRRGAFGVLVYENVQGFTGTFSYLPNNGEHKNRKLIRKPFFLEINSATNAEMGFAAGTFHFPSNFNVLFSCA